jgi:ParB/RepB/Spo0J family partition protein
MKIERVPVDGVLIPEGRREPDAAVVRSLAESMQRIGLLQPITVHTPDNATAYLVAGRHRLEAARELGWEFIDAIFLSCGDAERRMAEISENLHRAELTVQERSEQVAEWVRLASVSSISPQLGAKLGRPESGVKAAARELGMPAENVRRAVKIAAISPEAKDAAKQAGIDNNQSKLLAVASEPPEKQVAKVVQLRTANEAAKERPRAVYTWRDHFETLWLKGTEDDHAWARDFIDDAIMDKRWGKK